MYTLKGGLKQMGGNCNYGSCCSSEGRQFLTREEKIELLEGYKQRLDMESKGVAERIAMLTKTEDSDEE